VTRGPVGPTASPGNIGLERRSGKGFQRRQLLLARKATTWYRRAECGNSELSGMRKLARQRRPGRGMDAMQPKENFVRRKRGPARGRCKPGVARAQKAAEKGGKNPISGNGR